MGRRKHQKFRKQILWQIISNVLAVMLKKVGDNSWKWYLSLDNREIIDDSKLLPSHLTWLQVPHSLGRVASDIRCKSLSQIKYVDHEIWFSCWVGWGLFCQRDGNRWFAVGTPSNTEQLKGKQLITVNIAISRFKPWLNDGLKASKTYIHIHLL